jgi:hypothetical protein
MLDVIAVAAAARVCCAVWHHPRLAGCAAGVWGDAGGSAEGPGRLPGDKARSIPQVWIANL